MVGGIDHGDQWDVLDRRPGRDEQLGQPPGSLAGHRDPTSDERTEPVPLPR